MSTKTVSASEFADAMNEVLNAYSTEVSSGVKDAVKKTATQVKKDIQANAPVRTGKYKSGWTTKKVSETETSMEMTVYNKSQYRLTHLLEKGHANRGGGRTRAYPHIAPAEEAGEEMLISLIEDAAKG